MYFKFPTHIEQVWASASVTFAVKNIVENLCLCIQWKESLDGHTSPELFPVHPERGWRQKEKIKRKAIAKLFALHASAKYIYSYDFPRKFNGAYWLNW